jgi:hypothetical protein
MAKNSFRLLEYDVEAVIVKVFNEFFSAAKNYRSKNVF